MDYHTLFISDLTSMVIYTVALCAIAWRDRRVRGLRWFALYFVASLLKTILQTLKGTAPYWVTVFVANEINGLAFLGMFLGYFWFAARKPVRSSRVAQVVVAGMLAYAVAYATRSRWAFLISMIPIFAASAGAIPVLWRDASRSFRTAARLSAVVLLVQIGIGIYRTVVVTSLTGHPAAMKAAMVQPGWLAVTMSLMVLDSFYMATFLWLYGIEVQAGLRHQARTDDLTGALNRRAFGLEAAREFARARRHAQPVSLIVLDIDHFKRLNDSHGHAAGDLALRELVRLLTAQLRLEDLVARAGGEEFVVLLPATPVDRAREVAGRLRASVERLSLSFEGRPIAITASFGLACAGPGDETTWQDLLHRGDLAMYAAKSLGRNRVVLDESPEFFEAEQIGQREAEAGRRQEPMDARLDSGPQLVSASQTRS